MPFSLSKILDSAFAVAVLTAALYFLGLANHHGEAGALHVPRAVLQGDAWSTVAAGGDGVLLLCLFPFVFLSNAKIDWLLLLILVATPATIALVAGLWKSLPYRRYVLAIQAIVGLFILVFFVSYTHSLNGLEGKRRCLATKQCDDALQRVRAHIALGDKSVETRDGLVVNVNSTYWLLLTESGVLVTPKDGVKLVETAGD